MDSPKEAFYFTKDQLKIVLFLAFLIVAIGAGTLAYPYFKPATEVTDAAFLEDAKRLAATLNEKKQKQQATYIADASSKEKYTSNNKGNKSKQILFEFDPNTIGKAEWEKLGYSPKQAEAIERIKASGMVFLTAEDLKKVRIIGDEGYERLKDYVQIVKTPTPVTTGKTEYSKGKIDLNTGDSTIFETLPMVAAYLSSKLVSYRNDLGGYHSIEQIKEIKGLRESTYDLIKDKLEVSKGHIKKIAVNGTNDDLAKHPYCTKAILKSIGDYKSTNGRIKNSTELKEAIGNDELFNKLLPYISFQ